MELQKQVDRIGIEELVVSSLHSLLVQRNRLPSEPLNQYTRLLGSQAVLDSLGLVTLIVDVEQRLEEEMNIVVTLADERAVSQKHSPFQTVQSLTDYVCQLIREGRQGG